MPLIQSRESKLALLAAVGAEKFNPDIFANWQSLVAVDEFQPNQYSLLPLIYRNLGQLDIDHPWPPRLKGIYRRTRYANQVAQRSLADVVEALDAASLPVLVIGAAALAPTTYPEPALRPIHTPELVVSLDAVDDAIQTLNDLGWQVLYSPGCPTAGRPALSER